MEFASYQQAKIAINQFDGAMTKGMLVSSNYCSKSDRAGQTISIRLLPPVIQRGPAGRPGPQGAAQGSSGNLLARISGGAPTPNAPRGAFRGGRGGPRGV